MLSDSSRQSSQINATGHEARTHESKPWQVAEKGRSKLNLEIGTQNAESKSKETPEFLILNSEF
jgi:hypothetical protein